MLAGNVIFLPRGAVVIDIVPENNEDKSPWVVYMCADFKPLFISPITIPPQKTVLQMAKVRRTKEWAMLTPYWRQRILREGVCPEVHLVRLTSSRCNIVSPLPPHVSLPVAIANSASRSTLQSLNPMYLPLQGYV